MVTTAAAGTTRARTAAIRLATARAYVRHRPPGGGSVIIAPVLEVLFWLSVGLLVYTHAGYPLLLALLTAGKGSDPVKPTRQGLTLSVTLVIAAYNEGA